MTTSITNEYTSLQKYKSLTFYFRKGDVLLCVRDEWRQWQTAILTQVLLLIIAALLSDLGLICSTEGHWGPSLLQAGSHFGIPVSDSLTAAGTLSIFFLNSHLLPLFFGLFTQMHLLIDGSIGGQNITAGGKNSRQMYGLTAPLPIVTVKLRAMSFLSALHTRRSKILKLIVLEKIIG